MPRGVGVRVSSSSLFNVYCGNSSVGRAQPCQGWGRGSESRFPLFFYTTGKQSNSMNLYLRYFDKEILVNTVDEAIAFLSEIDEIGMNHMLEADIRDYISWYKQLGLLIPQKNIKGACKTCVEPGSDALFLKLVEDYHSSLNVSSDIPGIENFDDEL